ncbi:MAG: DPP IV N-terminal domain-containing protein [Chitinophagaceae bacterium]
MRKLIFCLFILPCAFISFGQSASVAKANYSLAARFSPKKLDKLVFSTLVDPHWLKKSNRFWYTYETPAGKKWYIVDPSIASKQELFDNAKLASLISTLVKDPFDAQHLGIDSIQFIKDEKTIQFQVKSSEETEKKDTSKKNAPSIKEKKVYYFEYNLTNGAITELKGFKRPVRKPGWASISPDKKFIVFAKNYNLYWMDSANYQKALRNEDDSTIIEKSITTDGIENYSYGGDSFGENNTDKEKNKNKRKSAFVLWSPDGKYFSMVRSDMRKVKDLWVINNVGDSRPTLETYKYHMPGETDAPMRELLLFDFVSKTSKRLNTELFKDQEISIASRPSLQKERDDEFRSVVWLGTNDRFYLSRTSRDLKKIDLCAVDVKTGEPKLLIEERLNTYVETRRPGFVNEGKELIHWSERDGWGHFYLYDGEGKLKNAITSGPFHCEDIEEIDEKNRVLYFTANGKEQGEDPYYLHLYRVNFDGSNLKLLNPGDFDNTHSMDDDAKYFINNFSRVNTAPKSILYDNSGRKIMDLETTDLSRLKGAGYKFPQPFIVKADDGITDLYGVMYLPFDFDSTKKYPIIEYVYPGPQTEAVNKSFSRSMDRTDRLAQFGFVVITVGNRGGHPSRSKWYHNFGYGNLRDYGLADKKAAIEQLADRYSFIDINRVGIHGHSGGGFMSTAAMLVYPDFFKVAVSSAGNHENNIYNRWWSEKHHGVREVIGEKNDTSFVYAIEKNSDLAKNLKGRLMLSTGDMDNNVHPANTIRMANALIKANKRFDFVLMPGQRHGFGDMSEYFFWMQADYFCKWLLGDFSQTVDVTEINKEVEQSGNKSRK